MSAFFVVPTFDVLENFNFHPLCSQQVLKSVNQLTLQSLTLTITNNLAVEREKVEAELSAMNPLSPEVRYFLAFEGFAEMYIRMHDLYPTQLEAYERLDNYYITIMGKRRHSEFSLFGGVLNSLLQK